MGRRVSVLPVEATTPGGGCSEFGRGGRTGGVMNHYLVLPAQFESRNTLSLARRSSSTQTYQSRPILLLLGAAAMSLIFAGCGEDSDAGSAQAQGTDGSGGPLLLEAAGGAKAGAADVLPARISDAAEAMDLSAVEMLAGAEKPAQRTVTSLAYQAPGTVEAAVKLHREQLLAKGWTALPETSVTPEYASAMFAKNGLRVSLGVMPGGAGKVNVTLLHHGNVPFERLPMVAGAKKVYAGPSTAIFTSAVPVDSAANETAAALERAGWAPIGSAANSRFFKQNAVKLTVMTSSAPGQGGATTLNFTSEMLPMDVPVPPSASDVEFSQGLKRFTCDTKMSGQECLDFYRASLGKLGWETTSDAPARVQTDTFVIFHNSAKDILRLGLRPGRADGEIRVVAEYMSAREIAEMKAKYDAQAEAHKAAQAGKN